MDATNMRELSIVTSESTVPDLVGTNLNGYCLDRRLGEGAFSWVYSGSKGSEYKSFKVAKPREFAGIFDQTACSPTQALVQITGAALKIIPNSHELLSLEFKRLNAIKDWSVVRVEQFFDEGNRSSYQAELISGDSLRRLFDERRVDPKTLLDLASVLARLQQQNPGFVHGDLKPENVLITEGGIKLVDLGYFGPIKDWDGKQMNVAITTPAYYPFLQPNDLLAFGLILWESATGVNPLSQKDEIVSDDLSPDLAEWIERVASTGARSMRGLKSIDVQTLKMIPDRLRNVLLRAINLGVDDQEKLVRSDGYKSFVELQRDLAKIYM
jgi:serine/threonine protein kinase